MNAPKTNETRNKIYRCAKELFYQNGYMQTNLKDIAQKADVPIALITYYFKKKIYIAANIYTDFIAEAGEIINEFCTKNALQSSLLKEMLLSYIIYDVILPDNNNKRFYMQLKEKSLSFYTLDRNDIERYFIEYIDEYQLTVTKQYMDILIKMNSEARRGFFNYYNEHDLKMDTIEIVNILSSMVPAMLGIERIEIDSKLLRVQSVIKDIDYSHLKLLI